MEINKEHKLRWSLGLFAVIAIALLCIFSLLRSSPPMNALNETETVTNAKAGGFPASHAIPWNKMSPEVVNLARPYGVLPASLPPLEQIGEGGFTEGQLRVYFKYHTEMELPTFATDIEGRFQHSLTVDQKEIYGAEHMYLSLPPTEARALYDLVSGKWRRKYPRNEDGFGFNQGILPYPTEWRDGDHFPVGAHVVSYSSYEHQPFKRTYLYLDPTTGRIRLGWHYGDQ